VALLVLDASIVIALLDPRDSGHSRAVAWFREVRTDEMVIPASSYAEVLVVPHRIGQAAVQRFERDLADVPVRVEPISQDTARMAAALRATHKALRLADALVIATGEILRGTVLTADRAWLRYSSRVRVL
jgi:predicted nucleic acid-binding protein